MTVTVINPCTPPSISVQPSDVTFSAGSSATFSVAANGHTFYRRPFFIRPVAR